jgi:hypothetical protein
MKASLRERAAYAASEQGEVVYSKLRWSQSSSVVTAASDVIT